MFKQHSVFNWESVLISEETNTGSTYLQVFPFHPEYIKGQVTWEEPSMKKQEISYGLREAGRWL